MLASADRTPAASLMFLGLAVLALGCIAETTRSPESSDTGLHSDTETGNPDSSHHPDSASDPDEDGIPSASDVCPDTYDPRQNDWDGDGAGDACDPTIDLSESNALVMRDLPIYEHSALQLASAGDFNGDGSGDFAIGVPQANQTAGEVRIFSGKELSNTTGILRQNDAKAVLTGEQSGELFGCAVGGVNDVNGDGRDDLVALQCRRNERQQAHLIFGRPEENISGDIGSYVDMSFDISRANGVPGVTILGLGDINADGLQDFAFASTNWMRVIRVILGAGSFPSEIGCGNYHCVDDWVEVASTVEIPDPTANNSPIHYSLLGDTNGDSVLDLGLVDGLETNGTDIEISMVSVGDFPTEIGSSEPLESMSQTRSYSPTSNLPVFTSLGDLNGDGLSDFSFSIQGASTTKVFFGDTQGGMPVNLDAPDTKIFHSSTSHLLGGLDINSDGFSDLIFARDGVLLILSGNRSWGADLSASGRDGFDATVSFPTEADVGSYAVESLKDFDGDDTAEFGIVLEGTDPDIDSGRIWIVDSDLPLL